MMRNAAVREAMAELDAAVREAMAELDAALALSRAGKDEWAEKMRSLGIDRAVGLSGSDRYPALVGVMRAKIQYALILLRAACAEEQRGEASGGRIVRDGGYASNAGDLERLQRQAASIAPAEASVDDSAGSALPVGGDYQARGQATERRRHAARSDHGCGILH